MVHVDDMETSGSVSRLRKPSLPDKFGPSNSSMHDEMHLYDTFVRLGDSNCVRHMAPYYKYPKCRTDSSRG